MGPLRGHEVSLPGKDGKRSVTFVPALLHVFAECERLLHAIALDERGRTVSFHSAVPWKT